MNHSGIAWIEDYKFQPHLPFSEEAANGFATALRAKNVFEHKNDQVVGALFLGKKAPVENAHIFYYSGHGTEKGPLFNAGDTVLSVPKVDLGSGDLAYAVFDCCRMLHPFFLGQWLEVFDGLHFLLGFGDFVQQSDSRGKIYAGYLRRLLSISDAWRLAAIETEGFQVPWAFLRAVTKGTVAHEEYWWNRALPRDPEPPLRFLARYEVPEMIMPSPPPVPTGRVPLLRTLAAPWTLDRKESLGQVLGLQGAQSFSGEAWSELVVGNARVELYDASGSFWARYRPPSSVELFKQPEAPPLAADAIERSRALLEQIGLLALVSLNSVAATVERHLEVRHPSGEIIQEDQWTTARHVAYAFARGNLPVIGPGAKLQVSFEGQRIAELLYFWRETVPVESAPTLPIINAEQVRGLLRKSKDFRHLPDNTWQITSMRLGYYALPPREEQGYLLPVYEVKGTFSREDFRYDFTRYVQAVPENARPQDSAASVFHRLDTVFS